MSSDVDGSQQAFPIKAASQEEYAAFIEQYAVFVGQIELRHVWLVRAAIENHTGPIPPVGGILRIANDSAWCPIEGGFRAESQFQVHVVSAEDAPIADIDVSFAVDFASGAPMTEATFALFGPNNLPLNTWPYLREFLSATFGRMNWPPFTLPALKRGTRPGDASESSQRTRDSSPEELSNEKVEGVQSIPVQQEQAKPKSRRAGRAKKEN